MTDGDIVLIRMMQSSGLFKIRPALVLKTLPKYEDILVCGISSKLSQEISGFDEILHADSNYFSETGLAQTSLVRLFYLNVQPVRFAIGTLGKIPPSLHKSLLNRLASFLSE